MPARWAVRFSVEGDARFLSHHDMMRLMERAAARAGLALKHSQGFNPRPRLSLVLPRPVGVVSRCERMTLEFDRDVSDAAWAEGFARQMPPGVTVSDARPLESARAPQVRQSAYEVALEGTEPAAVAARLAELARAPAAAGEGTAPPPAREVRRRLRSVELNGSRLSFALSGDATGPGRPRDVLDLLGLCKGTSVPPPGGSDEPDALARTVRTRLECDV